MTALLIAAAAVPALASGATQTQLKVSHIGTSFNPTAVVANSKGISLYMSTGDTRNRSNCYGQCTHVWKPLLVSGSLVAGRGVSTRLLGTTRRRDGTRQATYNGYPLYLYVYFPQAPGAYDGQGCGAAGGTDLNRRHPHWFLITPKGVKDKSDYGVCQLYA